MLKKLTYTAFTIALAASIASCNKDNNNNSATNPQLKNLFEGLKSTPQIFNIQAGNYETIEGALGTIIEFNPNSFLNLAGDTIRTGTIKIELIETPRYQQMIANRVFTTTANKERLISGGAVHIKATINNEEVKATQYALHYKQPTDNPSPMALYNGFESEALGGNIVQWNDDTTGKTLGARRDFGGAGHGFFYSFDSVTNFGWINCDYFYSDPRPKTDINVKIADNSFNDENTEVVIVFPSINSTSYLTNFSTNTFFQGYTTYFIPIGEQIHVMTIGEKNGKYYSFVQKNITVTNDITITATPQEVSAAQVKSQIDNL